MNFQVDVEQKLWLPCPVWALTGGQDLPLELLVWALIEPTVVLLLATYGTMTLSLMFQLLLFAKR